MADGPRDDEPLLGQPGDVSQSPDSNIAWNLYIGTAAIGQAGIWILAASVWASIFHSPLMLFSAHPLLNSAGILLITQAILILQPTHTPTQKRVGTNTHFSLNFAGLLALLAGLIVIVYNKIPHPHFTSIHARLGLITYIVLVLQALVGFTQYYTPNLYGGVDNAKAVYKYHRMSGYVILVLLLATVCAATQTDFNKNSLHIELWVMIVSSLLVLVGVLPRVKLQKLGLKTGS